MQTSLNDATVAHGLEQTRNIVIIGGGFAGSTLSKNLLRGLKKLSPAERSHWRLVLISEESYTTFNPMLPEAVGASIFPEQVVAPLREVLGIHRGDEGRARFIMGRVQQIDRESRRVYCDSLAGSVCLPYAHLILAFGNRARLDLIAGAEEHALPLKTVGDALHIRNTVLRTLAQLELCQSPEQRAELAHFVVIGGGFSGVEVAGELVDCLRSIVRYYPGVGPNEVHITLLHDGDRLLPELPPVLGQRTQASLASRGVDVRLQARATEIGSTGVTLANGSSLQARTVISTIGTRPNPLVESCSFANERGRISTDAQMRVQGETDIWALGDCAGVPNAMDGKLSPPTAQFAVRQGRMLASNLIDAIEGRQGKPFSHKVVGMMAAIGHHRGVAQVGSLPLSGLPAWLLWRAYYLSQMPTLGRKVRIFVEWTWGMFFPADITHIRFFRSRDLK